MASDRAQYNRALRRWDSLKAAGIYSTPVEDGSIAILCSDFCVGDTEMQKKLEQEAFFAEADDINYLLAERDIESRVYKGFSLQDAFHVIQDPHVSSIITIGNGNFSETFVDGYSSLDWKFIARASTHLKLGNFTMRHCGHPVRQLSVPLGTFALSDHSNVYAAFNTHLPTIMHADDEKLIKQIHRHERLGYRVLKQLFPGVELIKDADDAPDDEMDGLDDEH